MRIKNIVAVTSRKSSQYNSKLDQEPATPKRYVRIEGSRKFIQVSTPNTIA